jgi:AcrR family transcriptional regulator
MTVRKSKEQRRLEIIETALRLASVSGPDRITTEAIAAGLGMTQPAIFRHFPRKDDIWAAVLDWLEESLAEAWDGAAAGPSRLIALVGAHLDFIALHPALPLVLLSPDLQGRHPAIRQAVLRLTGRFHGVLTRALDTDGLGGGDPVRAAWLVIALIQGLALRWTAAGRSFDLRAEGAALLSLAIDGLREGGMVP